MKNEEKRLNKKGFTLVELIIVMAIMAILVGALAPRVMQYVERSREARDLQLVNSVHTAVLTAISSDTTGTPVPSSGDLQDYVDDFPEIDTLLGLIVADDADQQILDRCVSQAANTIEANTDQLTITYNVTTQTLTVSIGAAGGDLSVRNN